MQTRTTFLTVLRLILHCTCLMQPISTLFIDDVGHSLEVKNNSELILRTGSEQFSLQLLYLAELTSDYRQIIDSDGQKRKIDLNKESYEFSSITMDDSEHATYRQFSLLTKLKIGNNSAVMTLLVKYFFQPGNVRNLPFGTTNMKVGATEIKINLDNYTFCRREEEDCFIGADSVDGVYLDLAVGLNGVQGEIKRDSEAFTFENGKLIYSVFVDVNANLRTLETGYPKLIQLNEQQIIVLRFKKAAGIISSFKYSHLIAEVINVTKPSPTSSDVPIQPINAAFSKHKDQSQAGITPMVGASLVDSLIASCSLSYQTVYMVTKSILTVNKVLVSSMKSTVIACTDVSAAKSSESYQITASVSYKTANSYLMPPSHLAQLQSFASGTLVVATKSMGAMTEARVVKVKAFDSRIRTEETMAREDKATLSSDRIAFQEITKFSSSFTPNESLTTLNTEGFLKTVSVGSDTLQYSKQVESYSKLINEEVLSSPSLHRANSNSDEISEMISRKRDAEFLRSTNEIVKKTVVNETPFLTTTPTLVSGFLPIRKESSRPIHYSTVEQIKCYVTTVTLECSKVNAGPTTGLRGPFSASESHIHSKAMENPRSLDYFIQSPATSAFQTPGKLNQAQITRSFSKNQRTLAKTPSSSYQIKDSFSGYFPPLSASVLQNRMPCIGTNKGSLCYPLLMLSVTLPCILAILLLRLA